MTNRELAEDFVARFVPRMKIHATEQLELIFNTIAEDARAGIAAKLGWMCDEPTRPGTQTDEVTQ